MATSPGCQELPETGTDGKAGWSPGAFGWGAACDTLNLDFWGPRNESLTFGCFNPAALVPARHGGPRRRATEAQRPGRGAVSQGRLQGWVAATLLILAHAVGQRAFIEHLLYSRPWDAAGSKISRDPKSLRVCSPACPAPPRKPHRPHCRLPLCCRRVSCLAPSLCPEHLA